jgi:hypothetical protein
VQPETPVRERGVRLAVALDRHAAHEQEAAAALQRVEPALDRARERVERKVGALERLERLAGAARVRDGAIELGDLVGRARGSGAARGQLAAGPHRGRRDGRVRMRVTTHLRGSRRGRRGAGAP